MRKRDFYRKKSGKEKSKLVQLTLLEKHNDVWYAFCLSHGKRKIKVKFCCQEEFKQGDKISAILKPLTSNIFEASMAQRKQSSLILGVYKGGLVYPIERRVKQIYRISGRKNSVPDNSLVQLQTEDLRIRKKGKVTVAQVIKKLNFPCWQTYLSKYAYNLPFGFDKSVLEELKQVMLPTNKTHKDYTHIPFVTIDGEDAKDFDDAVWAEEDLHSSNPGGWHIMVAIADVSWYVRPKMLVDQEAYKRGNSVYFPDSVVPMLPEILSNELCSLQPQKKRASIICEVWIDKEGRKIKHKFHRALITSLARLTYTQVQRAFTHESFPEGLEKEISSLISAYHALKKYRHYRGVLELDVPEQAIKLSSDGKIKSVNVRERWESYQLIEEFMILANVAAAEVLEEHNSSLIYRVHDAPSKEKLAGFNAFISNFQLLEPLLGEDLTPADFNALLNHRKLPQEEKRILNMLALRAQSKAEYSPKNIGHFGLALEKYAHFTSPIRRYADLIVHRALVKALCLGIGGLSAYEESHLMDISEYISERERTSLNAENDANDRYIATYLENKKGKIFEAHISSLSHFGMNIIIDQYDFYGFVPKRLMGEAFDFDPEEQVIYTRHSGKNYVLGQYVRVKLHEADPYSGDLVFKLVV